MFKLMNLLILSQRSVNNSFLFIYFKLLQFYFGKKVNAPINSLIKYMHAPSNNVVLP